MEEDLHIFDESYPTDEDVYKYLVKDCQQLFDEITDSQKQNQELNQIISDQKSGLSISEGPKVIDQQFEQQKQFLMQEKKNLESQFLDIMMDIQKKKKQYADFQDQLEVTNQTIANNEKQQNEKQQFISFLESEIENLLASSQNQTKL